MELIQVDPQYKYPEYAGILFLLYPTFTCAAICP